MIIFKVFYKKMILTLSFLFISFFNSGCSDFRQAIGKEKFIPNEYSFVNTPRLIMPPNLSNENNIIEKGSNQNLKTKLNFKNEVKESGFNSLFNFSSVPKEIRKIVDEETLGISRSERSGIDVLLGNNPKVGIYLDSEKETLRIKNSKENNILSKPSPSINTSNNKRQSIK